VKYYLINSGCVPKVEQSLWEPTQQLIWLGTFIDSRARFYEIPDQRIDKILNTLITDLRACWAIRKTVRKVASFVGQIILKREKQYRINA
jgi:hypothetical protein